MKVKLTLSTGELQGIYVETENGWFWIHTDDNLPETHEKGITDNTYAELEEFVRVYGSEKQQQVLFGDEWVERLNRENVITRRNDIEMLMK